MIKPVMKGPGPTNRPAKTGERAFFVCAISVQESLPTPGAARAFVLGRAGSDLSRSV